LCSAPSSPKKILPPKKLKTFKTFGPKKLNGPQILLLKPFNPRPPNMIL